MFEKESGTADRYACGLRRNSSTSWGYLLHREKDQKVLKEILALALGENWNKGVHRHELVANWKAHFKWAGFQQSWKILSSLLNCLLAYYLLTEKVGAVWIEEPSLVPMLIAKGECYWAIQFAYGVSDTWVAWRMGDLKHSDWFSLTWFEHY